MDKIKILMAASEAIPYMKTGGLADVVGSLPKYFDKDRYDVRVILPKYKCMDDKLLPQLKFVCHFMSISTGVGSMWGFLHRSMMV